MNALKKCRNKLEVEVMQNIGLGKVSRLSQSKTKCSIYRRSMMENAMHDCMTESKNDRLRIKCERLIVDKFKDNSQPLVCPHEILFFPTILSLPTTKFIKKKLSPPLFPPPPPPYSHLSLLSRSAELLPLITRSHHGTCIFLSHASIRSL